MSSIDSQELADITADLEDLGILIEQLQEVERSCLRSGSADYHGRLAGKLVETFTGTVSDIICRREELLVLLDKTRAAGSSSELMVNSSSVRQQLIDLKAAVRVAFRQKGGLSTTLSRLVTDRISFEPSDSEIQLSQSARLAARSEDGQGLNALLYEEAFVDQYARHLSSEKLEAYATNSGMAAFSTILHVFSQRLGQNPVVMGFLPMYYENIYLLRKNFADLVVPELRSRDELLQSLRDARPNAVFFDAASNHGEELVHDIETVLSWASRENSAPVTLVIDTTCLPSVLLPAGLLGGLPDHVSVILLESLAKHHQFGMDLVTGGIMLLHGDAAFHADLQAARGRFGTELNEASAGTLPDPDATLLTRRMQRHSRNIDFLGSHLSKRIAQTDGIIESITWLHKGLYKPWYKTSALNIRFRKEYRNRNRYREFEYRVMEIARARNHRLALGSSFGFDVTRLFMTTPGTSSPDPFLRVSLGTETRAEIETFSDILFEAHVSLLSSWADEDVVPGEAVASGLSEEVAKTCGEVSG